ncbi:Cytochrome P450 CYP73A100 [Vitis vinifera]|uniref:Trans-cinnamate 4-monooxygenase n=1 Tax=Vitis vinifera TaxID=29760 RepID=A0A438GSY4_VITVI|nr:Cytochrome P450 CYP73A100 [Vitis vinifera]
MAHLLNKPVFFSTLLTIILLSSTRLLASYLSISPPLIASFLPLAPLILYLFYSISKRSASLPPGPLSIPLFGNWLQVGNDLNHQLLASMAQKYGPVFLLKLGSKNLAVVSDPELASQDMVFTVYGDHWRKMRRIMTLPFFTNKVVHHYSEMKRLQLMLYNIMYRMMFDSKFESQRIRCSYRQRGLTLKEAGSCRAEGLHFSTTTFVEKRREIMAAKGEKHKIRCAIDHIIDAQLKGEISEANVLYIVENINVAAIETTLWSMEWAIAELVNHPHVQCKIRDEITTILQGDAVTESNLHQLPYLQATVKETLRLHAPIPLLVPHMNLEEAKLGGYTIPKESKVVVNAWWLANNPSWWKNPEEFRPERFLEEESGTDAVAGGKVDFRFLPFGVGRRSCPGIILALPILALVIAKLVMNFEMRPPIGLEKIDVSEKGGQFSLHIANHSTVAFTPIAA